MAERMLELASLLVESTNAGAPQWNDHTGQHGQFQTHIGRAADPARSLPAPGRRRPLRPKARCDGYGPLNPVGDASRVVVEIEADVAVLVVDPRKLLIDDLD